MGTILADAGGLAGLWVHFKPRGRRLSSDDDVLEGTMTSNPASRAVVILALAVASMASWSTWLVRPGARTTSGMLLACAAANTVVVLTADSN